MRKHKIHALLIFMLVSLTGLSLGIATGNDSATTKKWNIITIVTDDQAVDTMGVYGNKEVVTPNLDRLAREGIRFTNAFACSGVCTPSRVAFITGMYPTQVGLTDVYAFSGWDTYGLPRGVPTWPRVLQQHGYVTGLIGKWHLGRTMEFYPTHYGLDHFFGFLRGTNFPMNPVLFRDEKVEVIPGSTPDILVDDAMKFIEKNKSMPFALMLHFRAPHLPFGPVPETDNAPLDDLDPTVPVLREYEVDYLRAGVLEGEKSSNRSYVRFDKAAMESNEKYLKGFTKAYYSSIHSIDRNVGRLLAKLEELNLDDKTIVLFTSDQGYLLGRYGMKEKGAAVPLRMGAFSGPGLLPFVNINMTDHSLQVPLVVRWPGVAEPGTVSDELVSNIDTFVSVLGMLGIPVPNSCPSPGMDFSPLLRGENIPWRDAIFSQYDPVQVGNFELIRMIRTKKWKLVRTYLNPGGDILIDLEKDPEELKNLYYPTYESTSLYKDHGQVHEGVHPYGEILNELQKSLTEWQISINDPALSLEKAYHEAIKAARDRWKKQEIDIF